MANADEGSMSYFDGKGTEVLVGCCWEAVVGRLLLGDCRGTEDDRRRTGVGLLSSATPERPAKQRVGREEKQRTLDGGGAWREGKREKKRIARRTLPQAGAPSSRHALANPTSPKLRMTAKMTVGPSIAAGRQNKDDAVCPGRSTSGGGWRSAAVGSDSHARRSHHIGVRGLCVPPALPHSLVLWAARLFRCSVRCGCASFED